MNRTWQMQEAKNKLSQIVDLAIEEGPQVITRHGKEMVIVISCEEYHRLSGAKQNLYDFFRNSPLAGSEIDLTRIDSLAPSPNAL